MMPDPIIDIKNITLKYDGKAVLKNFSMCAKQGEIICVTGASGCGKSSLLKAILGFARVEQGSIAINGECVCGENIYKLRKQIAYLPQDLAYPCEWVHEIAEVPFRMRANSDKWDKERLLRYFEKLGLERNILEKRISEISGGQRQRVMIAIAALMNKKIILLDEPTSALDRESTRSVIDFLRDIDGNPLIIAVTHDSFFAKKCDREITLQTES